MRGLHLLTGMPGENLGSGEEEAEEASSHDDDVVEADYEIVDEN